MKAHKEYRIISIYLEKFLNLNLRNLKINSEPNVQIHEDVVFFVILHFMDTQKRLFDNQVRINRLQRG